MIRYKIILDIQYKLEYNINRGYEAYQNRINRGYEAYQNRINRGYEA